MLTQVTAGPYTIRGVSVGGVYTSLLVPELGVMLDAGASPRSFVGARALFLSHGHVDHAGALPGFLGIRALCGKDEPLRVYLPAEIADHVTAVLAATSRMQRYDLAIEPIPMKPGQVELVRGDLWVRAIRTFHPVPSLGYQFLRRIDKLRPEYRGMRGREIEARRRAGEDLFEVVERLELAYATDTLSRVLETEPGLLDSRVLILECTFLDERKTVRGAQEGCHIHLDELIAMAGAFRNDHLVLMHFSQIYKPREVVDILRERLPEPLLARIVPFAPRGREWPG